MNLKRGDIVRNKATGESFVVERGCQERCLGIRIVEITNENEWEIIKKKEK